MSVFLIILKALIALVVIGAVVLASAWLVRHLRAIRSRPRRQTRKERRRQNRKVKRDRRQAPRRNDDVALDFLKKL